MISPAADAAALRAPVGSERESERVDEERSRLVREAAAGDQDAFAALYRQSLPTVSRYVGAILGDQARTEDAVAQTFLDAWLQLPRLRESSRFDGWLLRIAHNRAIDELRRRPAQPLESAQTIAAPSRQEPERAAIVRDSLARVRAALLTLPEDQREAVVLRHLMGLSHAEMALHLDRSEEASRALLHRGVRALRTAAAEPE